MYICNEWSRVSHWTQRSTRCRRCRFLCIRSVPYHTACGERARRRVPIDDCQQSSRWPLHQQQIAYVCVFVFLVATMRCKRCIDPEPRRVCAASIVSSYILYRRRSASIPRVYIVARTQPPRARYSLALKIPLLVHRPAIDAAELPPLDCQTRTANQ